MRSTRIGTNAWIGALLNCAAASPTHLEIRPGGRSNTPTSGCRHRRLDTAHAGVHVLSTLGGYARAHRALKRLAVPLAPFPAPSRPSVDRATEYPYDAQPERRPVAIPRRQQPRHADAAAAAARPEQTGRALPGRSLVAPLNRAACRAAGIAHGPVRRSRSDSARRLSPRRLERRTRSPRPGRARGAPAGLCLTRSPHGGRHRRQWSTRHGASGATRIRQRNCRRP